MCTCAHVNMGGCVCTEERVPPITLEEKRSFPSMSYVKKTIKTELNCQAPGKTSRTLLQIKVTQGRTLSKWVCLRDWGLGLSCPALGEWYRVEFVSSQIAKLTGAECVCGGGEFLKSISGSSSLFFLVQFKFGQS